ncbi:MAG: hypothetical protein QOH14_1808, partial [Pseudonocardiales bacterium]|nr:hypothetical protein [Pseudonocardiales bacterium]
QSAMGLPHNWFSIASAPPSAPTNVVATARDAGVTVTWGAPASSGTQPITGYTVTVGTQTLNAGAAARSATVIGLINGRAVGVAVRAKNIVGASAAATSAATPNAAPQRITAVAPARLFDTRSPAVAVDSGHPYAFTFAGKGDIPATAGAAVSVQFALTIVNPTGSGTLHVQTAGAPVGTTSAIAYRRGRTVTTTVSVPVTPTSSVRFVPSAGAMALIADQMSYTGPGLSAVASVAPARVAFIQHVPIGSGVAVRVRGVAGVPSDASAVVLGLAGGPASGSGWLRVWADGAPVPGVSQAMVTPDGTGANTVVVPIGSNGNIRVGSNTPAVGVQVTVVGYVAPAASGRGLLETFQSTGLSDPAAGVGASLAVSTSPTSVVVLGKPQVPHGNVQAVLLQVTVTRGSAIGGLYAYAAGAARPAAYSLTFPQGTASTSTVLVRVGSGGAIQLATSGPTAVAAVDIVGWVNAG